MNDSKPAIEFIHASDTYRSGRRRWVPKGVALLIILFIVGLLNACQSATPDSAVAEIVVPVGSVTTAGCRPHMRLAEPIIPTMNVTAEAVSDSATRPSRSRMF